jgi:hypothetical protein
MPTTPTPTAKMIRLQATDHHRLHRLRDLYEQNDAAADGRPMKYTLEAAVSWAIMEALERQDKRAKERD